MAPNTSQPPSVEEDSSGEPATLKRVFLSSTVYDLLPERTFIKGLLERHSGIVRFRGLSSNEPDFPNTPTELQDAHSYDMCLNKVAISDYFVLLIKQRYGTANIEDAGQLISITHKEYRTAFERRLPLFTFVDARTWNARNNFKKGLAQDFVPPSHTRLFDFIDEVAHQKRSNWINFYRDTSDIKATLEGSLFGFDDSIFVADVTIPDGSTVRVNQEFEKVWEIKNNGCQLWEGRFLREENAGASGLAPETHRVRIGRTLPSRTVRIAVTFKAPKYPGTCETHWKMVDDAGRYYFPDKKELFCRVKVIY